jgi:diaminohydroxyphosphoribosylaminopyrimidine deaminase / 5-amino-6-(5-phosphoribosylamino)uracil reductase
LDLFSSHDSAMMALAIKLAAQGRFTTRPNPNVGCIICDPQGKIIGQGWHYKAGTPHAEVHALAQAGSAAKGATAYVTLEPCSHQGRTPPCAQALIRAGLAKVVVAMVDPNPLVAGKGLCALRDSGIEVAVGLMEAQAAQLNRGFIKRMRLGMPWVTVKLAASLDGKTALANGLSQWITGPKARQDVQRHRAQSCAILSGSGTVLADDPGLNVRHIELGYLAESLPTDKLQQPLRVLLDGRGQIHPGLKLFDLPGDVLLVNSQASAHDFSCKAATTSQWQAPTYNDKLDLKALMLELGNRQINHLWVEAGGKLAGALLENNLLDELILYQAPKLLGDQGRDLFVMQALTTMQQAYNLQWQDIRQVGEDLKLTAYFNN